MIILRVFWVFAGVLIVLQGEPVGSVKEDGGLGPVEHSEIPQIATVSLRLPLSPRS